ncbi:L,D-transpeptidase family protein [Vaginisenegalia massiliensis]|uniref:L,D-transpeptidase family protein n=1 Tax=Vaginisenegalia massiliensis TaxID=2058294 RepID=UPI000F54B5A9|nr:L,D-transpeptidase family protein [Vaginisenegalia massiliensis]
MKKTIGIILGLLIIIGIGYGAGIGYYADRFQANTKFGSVDISNLKLDQAQKKLEDELNKKTLSVKEQGQEIGKFSVGELKGKIETKGVLKEKYLSQDPRFWLLAYFKTTKYDQVLSQHVQFDGEALSKALTSIGLDNQKRHPAQDAKIDYADERGYFVTPEKAGNQVDLAKVQTMMIDGIQKGQNEIDIKEAYKTPKILSTDKKITQFMKQIDQASQVKLTLKIKDKKIPIAKTDVMKWMSFDANNQIVFDQGKIQEFVKGLNDQYATFNKTRTFNSTLSGQVQVQPGTLGWSIDSETEAAQIAQDLKAGKEVTREPAIVGTGYNNSGTDDIGNTYVEVDIAHQTMFIYIDGKKQLETPVVTGLKGVSETVPGAYAIWGKERNATLRGVNGLTGKKYASPVAYWMPFDQIGQGLHDAGWQPTFGGDFYLTNGSNGCVNISPAVMPQVFDLVQEGTPVIIF